MYRIEQRREFRPHCCPAGAEVNRISISPDETRIAYFAKMAAGSGLPDAIVIEPIKRGGPESHKCDLAGGTVSDLRWSPDGTHLAWCLVDPRTEPCTPLGIGWEAVLPGDAGEREDRGQTNGMCFAWMPSGNGLVVASSAFLRLVNIRTYAEEKIADLNDDGDPLFTPRIAVSCNGQHIAYTTRRTDENISRVWITTQTKERWECRLLTSIPGAFVFISPFWSPDCTTLGLHMVHPKMEKSSITIFPGLAGEGEIIYESPLLNPSHEPSWAPCGEGIIFFHTSQPHHKYTKAGPAQLALLSWSGDHPTGIHLLTEPSDTQGSFRFIDNRQIVMDGVDTARLMNFSLLEKR